MASLGVELIDLNSASSSSPMINLPTINLQDPSLMDTLSIELSRVQVKSEITIDKLESQLSSGLKSPDTLNILLQTTYNHGNMILQNLDALARILNQSPYLKSSFIKSNSSILKIYINLSLLKK